MEWKNSLTDIMTDNKLFRLEILNKMIPELCKEWVDYFNEFNGASAKWKYEYRYNYSGDSRIYLIEATLKSLFPDMPFVMKLCFDTDEKEQEIVLKTIFSVGINTNAMINGKDDEKVIYKEEELNDPDLFCKEGILQQINYRYKDWIRLMKERFPRT